ncbi:PHP domain-containing protein [Isoptericola croceus]|uniref:PHP domain-containing protein n=1 Tax=Isoptericola croceus TaxID=3031406 RepID=UPI0023F7719A|nr:PHP domain-containing protein [Isoptericola croceus]
MTMPADSHVHSEWSWDTGGPDSHAVGRMRSTCAQAVRIGLEAVYFTEHLDIPDTWRAEPEDLMPHQQGFLNSAGRVDFAPFDAAGYLGAIDRMRHEFPDLRIHTGVEFGQPHLVGRRAAEIVDLDLIDRVLGSLHTLDLGDGHAEPHTLFRDHHPAKVMDAYLEQVPVMVNGSDAFEISTHIDYAVRTWPARTAGPFDPRPFEEGFRVALRSIAEGGRALEMNTRRLWSWIPEWWADAGGKAVSFGSDAHTPDAVAANFPEATAMLEHFGFRPGSAAEELWVRSRVV